MGKKTIFGIIIGLMIIWGAWAGQSWILSKVFVATPTLEERGQWGDTFGALNALLSSFAFVGVVVTLWLQQRQISDSQKDLHKQRFENTFFQLLKLIREAREQVRFRHSRNYRAIHPQASEDTATGHLAFRAAYREMRHWVELKLERGDTLGKEALADIYAKKIHAPYESTFGAYYRLIYAALDRLRTDDHLTQSEKDDLGNLVRGQLTSFEAVLAGYNGLNDFAKDFDEIIIRFRLLKYARRGILYDKLHTIYPKEAFLGRDEVDEPAPAPEDDEDAISTET